MKLDITIHHRYELDPQHAHLLGIHRELKMISAEVQAVLDRAKQTTSLVHSVDLGMKALAQQVSDLKAQIAAMPVGNVLSDEDKAGLLETANDLDTSISTLAADIPANTTPATPALNSAPAAQTGGEGQPAAASTDQAGAQVSAPQPLPGTGIS